MCLMRPPGCGLCGACTVAVGVIAHEHLSDDGPLPSCTLAEAQIHDLSVLPHMHSECDIEKIEAAPETANSRYSIPGDEDPAEGRVLERRILKDRWKEERDNRSKRENLIMPEYIDWSDYMR